MSILKVDTIRDNGSGFNDVVSFQNVNGTENGRLCRAFVNFNGQGAVAMRANFNVNSISDGGTGVYTVNFSNSLSDANFACAGNHSSSNDGVSCTRLNTFAAGSINISTFIYNAFNDPQFVTIEVFR